jgi:hypothetical protein
MLRVPVNAARPTFDETVKVGFFSWLTSSRADRQEWARRRNAAAKAARVNQNARAAAVIEQSMIGHMIGHKAAEQEARKLRKDGKPSQSNSDGLRAAMTAKLQSEDGKVASCVWWKRRRTRAPGGRMLCGRGLLQLLQASPGAGRLSHDNSPVPARSERPVCLRRLLLPVRHHRAGGALVAALRAVLPRRRGAARRTRRRGRPRHHLPLGRAVHAAAGRSSPPLPPCRREALAS